MHFRLAGLATLLVKFLAAFAITSFIGLFVAPELSPEGEHAAEYGESAMKYALIPTFFVISRRAVVGVMSPVCHIHL